MNLTEDRLRAALMETAEEILACSVPRLELPPDTLSASRRADSWSRAKRLRRWPAAVAAAAAVCLVAGLSVAVSDGGQAHHPAANYGYLLNRVPRYYMSMLSTNWRTEPEEAVVHDTVTGAVVATIRPPSPFVTFNMVAAAPDDRTFVLAASPGYSDALLPSQLYLARLNPASHSIRLTRAPIPEFGAHEGLLSLAVSPNGKELAVGLAPVLPNGHFGRGRIQIYSLNGHRAAGPVKVWTAKTTYSGYLSWVRAGITFVGLQGLSLLNTRAPSGSLQGASRLVWPMYSKTSPGYIRSWGPLTDGGKAIVTEKQLAPRGNVYSFRPGFEEVSVATGKPLRSVGPLWPGPVESGGFFSIIWTNSAGSVAVVEAPALHGKPSSKHGGKTVLAVVGGNAFEPIPGAPPVQTSPSSQTQFAF